MVQNQREGQLEGQLVGQREGTLERLARYFLVTFFLAPTGAQEMLMFVCSFGSNLSRAVNLHHSVSNLQAISQE